MLALNLGALTWNCAIYAIMSVLLNRYLYFHVCGDEFKLNFMYSLC